jgi:lipopolysaccharide transport system ATP-binding protein
MVSVDGLTGNSLQAVSGESEIIISVSFTSDPALPPPVVGMGFETNNGQIVTSVFTNIDQLAVNRTPDGRGEVAVSFKQLPLLKGRYWVGVVLACENGIHIYELAMRVAEIQVAQSNLMVGLVSFPHEWKQPE